MICAVDWQIWGSTANIIAKIETKSAVDPENLEEIVKASDGIMVARGDLAVEAGAEIVPVVQRRIIALCRKILQASNRCNTNDG